jgi:ribonuclease E
MTNELEVGAATEATGAGGGSGATGARRRRRRGGRGRGGRGGGRPAAGAAESEAGGAEPSESEAGGAEPSGAEPGGAEPTTPAPKASSRRSSTTNPASREPVRPAAPPAGSDAPEGSETPGAPTTPTRRRRSRGGRGRGGSRPSTTPAADEEAPVEETPATQRDDAQPDSPGAEVPARSPNRRRRRRGRGGKGTTAAATETDAQETAEARPQTLEERVAAGGPTRGIRATRPRTGRERRRRESMPIPPRVTDKVMVITEHGERDQIAVLEENMLVQHYVTRQGAKSMVGNVYLGRVQNVLPGMEAAFVDVGRGRNAVLYAGEVNYSPEDLDGAMPRIEQVLKPAQAVMVQVTKDPMGGKGARLTAQISLPGRFLVLAPNQNVSGISRRLPEAGRRRLKAILKNVKPDEHGVIVRTAAEGASEEAIVADLQALVAQWDEIQKVGKRAKAPAVLYEEPELTVRVVRDLFTDEEFKELATDSPRVYDKVMAYVRTVAPDLAPKVTLHQGKLSAFEHYRVVEQIHKALDRKVWLPSGGYLVIERTEAMTIVDVNTGKSVGKTNLEETVANTNLEAAREVARQLRLRDIGGIIVIDFIDMLLDQNRKKIEETMKEALAVDKTRSQVFEIGPLGLMQVTRKRVSGGLVESFSETCPTCEGRGIILNYDVS